MSLNQNNDFSILARIRIENEECDTISQSFTFGALNVSLGENEISYNGKFLDFIPGGCTYKIDTTKSHILNLLEIDTVNEIVSGTFEFSMISEDFLDTINVTDGRFDTKY